MISTINGHVSHWFSGMPTPRAALPGDRVADVCIVGAGYTGLWTAYYLAEHDPSLPTRSPPVSEGRPHGTSEHLT